MLVLSETQVQSLIDIDELIAALEQAHMQYSTGRAVMPVNIIAPTCSPRSSKDHGGTCT